MGTSQGSVSDTKCLWLNLFMMDSWSPGYDPHTLSADFSSSSMEGGDMLVLVGELAGT